MQCSAGNRLWYNTCTLGLAYRTKYALHTPTQVPPRDSEHAAMLSVLACVIRAYMRGLVRTLPTSQLCDLVLVGYYARKVIELRRRTRPWSIKEKRTFVRRSLSLLWLPLTENRSYCIYFENLWLLRQLSNYCNLFHHLIRNQIPY